MIDRYAREEMKNIWSDKSKFDAFLKIEILNAEALHGLGVVSNEELSAIQENASYQLENVYEFEKEYKHDVIAFTRAVSLSLGDEKRFIHYGLTSTDVVDTAYGILFQKANKLILDDAMRFLEALKEKAFQFKNTFCIGRTHGIHADITTFGLKFALYYDELKRNISRFKIAASEVEVGKISGAVGNYAFVNPKVEEYICKQLGLGTVNISTQVLQRDRHANYMSSLVLMGSTIEKIATEIRNLQRTEIGEVREPFSAHQKGSSAMPHKRNPIVSENMCGIMRVMRGYLVTAFENIALWHERDISHSSAERIIIPDATILIDYMFNRYYYVIKNLVVYPENMKRNIYATNGIIFSQRVLSALIDKGVSREQAYDMIQPLAYDCYEENRDFIQVVSNDVNIKKYFSEREIEELFDLDYYKRNIDCIYDKVFVS